MTKKKPIIEFVSYDGRWPNLCSGELILKINGRKHIFGINYGKYHNLEDMEIISKFHHSRFWTSGGSCGWDPEEWVDHKPWVLYDVSSLPKSLQPYAQDLIDVFNENVPWGCCGGCI